CCRASSGQPADTPFLRGSRPVKPPGPRTQPVPQVLSREVRISRQSCPDPVKDNLQDPAKIVSLLSYAVGGHTKGRVEAVRVLPSGDLILWVDSERSKQDLHIQVGWLRTLGEGARLNRPRFTVLVK